MPTDAEILREIAESSYMGATASGEGALIVLATALPKGDIDEAIQHAARAIEENARLREAVEILRDTLQPIGASDATYVRVHFTLETRSALVALFRKPDAD